jgi:hypothetical protein
MSSNKIFILLPDGVGLRNFAFTNFNQIGLDNGYDIIYWNNTPFDIINLGFKEIKIKNTKTHPLTDSYKNARKHIELILNMRVANDRVYDSYRFPLSYKTVKTAIKSSISQLLIVTHSSPKGIELIRKKIKELEVKTTYYQDCLKTLKREQPAMVLSTNQRPVNAIAPLLAAQELGIPTATFIFSWDNLPKATMVVETDFYFVWSEHMKKELLYYYSYIEEKQIFVTGTTQFEPHFNLDKIQPKKSFFQEHRLDIGKKYICYSGDDITTCPDDPSYLEDVAMAVRQLNKEGNSLGIIFRRCPIDFSNRFDDVLKRNYDVITSISPKWQKIGNGWNTILPTLADLDLQISTISHTEMVVNLGSSMIFDYVAHGKPCAFINYDVKNKVNPDWSVSKIYNYVHFRSMPAIDSVIWLNSVDELADKIKAGLDNSDNVVNSAQKWFEIIAGKELNKASEKIWNTIEDILK